MVDEMKKLCFSNFEKKAKGCYAKDGTKVVDQLFQWITIKLNVIETNLAIINVSFDQIFF